jgi:hypothetical protein
MAFERMARTIMVEHLNVHPDVIEAQLAHGKSGHWVLPTTAPSSWRTAIDDGRVGGLSRHTERSLDGSCASTPRRAAVMFGSRDE